MQRAITGAPRSAPRPGRPASSHWRAFAIGLVAAAGFTALALPLWPGVAGLYLLMLYCVPSNSILPIPHEPGVLYVAAFYDPLAIAIAATVGAGLAAYTDYAVVEAALRHPRVRRARDGRLFQWAIRKFRRAPFATVFAFSLTPLPVYVVRVLAPAAGYPRARYVAAIVLGRFPRFWVVAAIGHALPIPSWALLGALVVMVATSVLTSRGS